jgi:hypothetical protein
MSSDLIKASNNASLTPYSDAAQAAIIDSTGASEAEIAQYRAIVSMELFKLRTAYPTQARNYSDIETDALTALWLEVFTGIDGRVLHQAVIRFITDDRKAFFPSPGQIMGYVEQINKEIEAEKQSRAFDMQMQELREYEWLISEGEHCGNCAYSTLETICHRSGSGEVLICNNRDSFYFTGLDKTRGTTSEKRCDLFRERNCKHA